MNRIFSGSGILALLWLIVATVLFCLPGSKLPAAGWMDWIKLDKWIHIGIFLLLYLLWIRVVKWQHRWLLLLLLVAYGCLIEWVQDQFIANRSYDLWDIAADCTGILLGLLLSRYIKNKPL